MCAVFQLPLCPSKPGTLSSKEIESVQPVLDLPSCVETLFPSSDSTCTPLFCFSMWVIWHLANTTDLVPYGEGVGSFWCRSRGVHERQLPWIGSQEAPGGQYPLLKPPSSVSMWVKCCSIQCFDCILFFLATPTPRHSGQKYSDFYSWK